MQIKLTKNLILQYIEENVVKENKLITVYITFSFFGELGEVYFHLKNLKEEWASYAMTQITSELSDSFNDLLEDDEVFNKIKEKVELFAKEWAENQAEYEANEVV